MWSNISAPKSNLKAAQVGHQLKPKQVLDQHRENCSTVAAAAAATEQQDSESASKGQKVVAQTDYWSSPGIGKSPIKGASSGSPLMRYKHAVCASTSSGSIYIHGGRFGNGVPLDDDVWRFDPHENAWLQLRTSGCRPPSLQEHSLVEHQNQLYLFGGQVSAASGQENSFWRLDLASCKWFSLDLKSSMRFGAYLGPSNRRGHSACVYRDSMYIFGGYEDFRGSTNQLWQFDLLSERWELRNLSSSSACHPEARHAHSAIIHADSMYIYGGLSNLKPLADLWRWSWRDKRWFKERTRGKSPGALHGHSAIQAFGSMFVFGGERASGRTTRSLWRLNLSNLCWQKIKTKGPRPNPTTWHVAIANPMGILDEANYLIEGESSDLEADNNHHLQYERQQLTLMVVNKQSSNNQQPRLAASDNCFSQQQQQQTIPMASFRPVVAGNQQQQGASRSREFINGQSSNHPKTLISHSKSSIEQISCSSAATSARGKQVAAAAERQSSRDRTKAKRRLRLSFLRPNKAKAAAAAANQKMPTSVSAASILNGAQSSRLVQEQASKKKKEHHHTLPATDTTEGGRSDEDRRLPNNDVEMAHDDVTDEDASAESNHRQHNVGILESLDSDIKEMFQRAMSPEESSEGKGACVGEEEENNSASRLTRTSTRLARNSMTQSQLSSSWLAPMSTMSYKTAREQLTSNSTLSTITQTLICDAAAPVGHQQHAPEQVPPSSSRLADVRQRRSMQQFNHVRRSGADTSGHNGTTGQMSSARNNGRPKSEIVQSLIDRADARIKHLYTPYFNLDQPHNRQQQQQQEHKPKFNSNDPLLGALANHRMFERDISGGGGGGGSSKRPALDKSNRRTIHETTTYYNLYFGQEQRDDVQLSGQPASSDLTTQSSSTSSGGVTGGGGGEASNGYNLNLSTSAALVGVRDGMSTLGSQRTKLGSDVSSLTMASSESQTLCDSRVNNAAADAAAGELQMANDNEMQYEAEFNGQQENRGQSRNRSPLSDSPSVPNTGTGNNGDNTSLSFSVIAEFEEDDMLQYSSPTDPIITTANHHQNNRVKRESSNDEEERASASVEDDQDDGGDYYEDHDELMEQPYGTRRNFDSERQHERHHRQLQQQQQQHDAADHQIKRSIVAQKSSSSGYDSLRSSSNNGFGLVKQRDDETAAAAAAASSTGRTNCEYSTSSSLQTTTGSSPAHTTTSYTNNNKSNADANGRRCQQAGVPMGSACDSLTTSESLPMTPPSKSLPSSPHAEVATTTGGSYRDRKLTSSSFASSLISGPSRFFGKKKTKTRYWQLCMFVLGGKQAGGQHAHGNLNEPISIWRLYI